MSLCSQLLELLPTETWESISNFVFNSRNMKSSDSKTPMRRQKQITEKVYLTWNLWGPGRDNSNYCLVIWSKKDMLPSPQRSPKVSSNHHRKKFLVCNRLPGLHSWPGTIKPLASRKGTKANHTSHIQGDLQVCGSRHARIQPEPNSMPRGQKLLPPLKIKTKLLVNPYGWSLLLRQHGNKTMKKGCPWPNYLSSMV